MSDKEESVDPGLVKLTARGSCVECHATYEHQLDVTARFQGIPFFVPQAWAQVIVIINEPFIPPAAEVLSQGTVGAMPEDMAKAYLTVIQDSAPPFQSIVLLCPSCLERGTGTPRLWAWVKKDFDMAVYRHVEEVAKGQVFDFPGKFSEATPSSKDDPDA